MPLLRADLETVRLLCELLDIDPRGLRELGIHWSHDKVLTHTASHVHAAREALKARESKFTVERVNGPQFENTSC
jgi:hypothetical protein